jgi:hypothetical protein
MLATQGQAASGKDEAVCFFWAQNKVKCPAMQLNGEMKRCIGFCRPRVASSRPSAALRTDNTRRYTPELGPARAPSVKAVRSAPNLRPRSADINRIDDSRLLWNEERHSRRVCWPRRIYIPAQDPHTGVFVIIKVTARPPSLLNPMPLFTQFSLFVTDDRTRARAESQGRSGEWRAIVTFCDLAVLCRHLSGQHDSLALSTGSRRSCRLRILRRWRSAKQNTKIR